MRGKFRLSLGIITLMLFLFTQGGTALGAVGFRDIEGHWAKEAIEGLKNADLLQGFTDGTFRPGEKITRGQFLILLVKAARIPEETYYPPTFSDVPVTDLDLYRHVETAAQVGIVSGDGERFYPNRPLDREELAVMVIKALGEKEITAGGDIQKLLGRFSDAATVSPWARGAVARAVELGILSGRGDKFVPQGTTARGEAAVVAWKLWNQSFSGTADKRPEQVGSSEVDSLEVLSSGMLRLNFSQEINISDLAGKFSLLYKDTALSPGMVREVEVVNRRQLLLTVPRLETGEEYSLLIRDLSTASGKPLTVGGPLAYHFSLTEGQKDAATAGSGLPPEVVSVQQVPGTNDRLEVIFSRRMDKKSAVTKANYKISLAEDITRRLQVEEVELGQDEKTAVIGLAAPLDFDQGYRYFITGVKDASGNEILPQADYFRAGWGSGDSLVSAVQALSATELELTFARRVREHFQPENYGVVEIASGDILPIIGVEAGGKSEAVRLFLGKKMTKGEGYLVSAGRGIKDLQGDSLGIFTGRVVARFDLVPPRLTKIESIDGRRFRLTFDKDVERLLLDLPGFDFKVELFGTVAMVESRNRQLALGSKYALRFWADGSEEAVRTNAWQEAVLRVVDEIKPSQVTGVTAVSSHRIKVEFDKPVVIDLVRGKDNFRLAGFEEDQPVYPVRVDYEPASFTAYLTLPAHRILQDTAYHLQISGIIDAAGNLVSGRNYGFYGVDTVPPSVYLPPLANYQGYPLVIEDNLTPDKDYIYGEPGAVEKNVYVKVSVDGQAVGVTRAKKDGSFSKLSLGNLQGVHSLALELIDAGGNRGKVVKEYKFN